MFAGKKSAQIREILISESAWEEMTCLFAPSLGITRESGQYSPQGGHWQLSSAAVSAVVSLRRGDVMPYYQGKPATWSLIQYDLNQEAEI